MQTMQKLKNQTEMSKHHFFKKNLKKRRFKTTLMQNRLKRTACKSSLDKQLSFKRRGLCYLTIYLSLLPMISSADVVSTLNNFLGYLTGDVGKAVAGLAIVGIGFGCFALGRVPKAYVASVVIGVGVIFGAQAILSMLTG